MQNDRNEPQYVSIPLPQPGEVNDILAGKSPHGNQEHTDPATGPRTHHQGTGRPSTRRERAKIWARKHPAWTACIAILLMLLLAGGIGATAVVVHYYGKASEFDLSKMAEIEAGSLAVDRQGRRIGRISLQDRKLVRLDEVPAEVINALVATEDSRYFEHSGYDLKGIARAAVANLKAGGVVQGGSTITQQLARHAFSLGGRNLDRKMTELFLALRIEEQYDKKEILEHYLNRIYLGNGYWGVGAAAEGYFGVAVKDLTVPQAATLAAIIKSPNRLSPFSNPEEAKAARNRTLVRMADLGMIDTGELHEFQNSDLAILKEDQRNSRPHYLLAQIRQEALSVLGRKRSLDGLVIETSIDSELHDRLAQALNRQLAAIESRNGYPHPTWEEYQNAPSTSKGPPYLQGAAVVIENATGQIVSAVGGRDFRESQFNRVWMAKRAPGSAFFPFVYAAAMESGTIQALDLREDAPLNNRRVMIGGTEGVLGEWSAELAKAAYQGKATAAWGLAASRNNMTARIGLDTGVKRVIAMAHKAGITSDLRELPATLLGESEVSPLELVHAYTVFPNRGWRSAETHLLTRIKDEDGKVLWQKRHFQERRIPVMSEEVATQINAILHTSMKSFASLGGRQMGGNLAGKTGTSYKFEDNWFVGYNGRYTWGVWMGLDDPEPIFPMAFGHYTAMPVWAAVAGLLDSGEPLAGLEKGGGNLVCLISGEKAGLNCAHHPGATALTAILPDLPGTRENGNGELPLCSIHQQQQEKKNSRFTALASADQSADRSRPWSSQLIPIKPKVAPVIGSDPYAALEATADPRKESVQNSPPASGNVQERAFEIQGNPPATNSSIR